MNRSILTVLLTLAAAGSAFANGVYIPPVGYPDLPAIPAQRAIISWRGGLETLVVESSLDTSSPAVGWILPLPAEPTALAPADPGVLTAMALCQRPHITSHIEPVFRPAILFACLLAPFFLCLLLLRDRGRLWPTIRGLLYLELVLLIFAAIMLPMFMSAGAGGPLDAAVAVSSQSRVGNYDATVLRAKDAAALDAWLSANALQPLTPAAKAAVNDYIARKWCFVVARLAKDPGPAIPHPIAATFPTDKPVFPMKLTGLARSKTRVELFVIAANQHSADGFTRTASDAYRPVDERPLDQNDSVGSVGAHYAAAETGLVVGHPDIARWMWPGCVVTALAADLTPADMTGDIYLSPEPLAPHRARAFTAGARRDITILLAVLAALGLLIASAFLFKGRRKPTRPQLQGFLASALAAILCIALLFFSLPVLPTTPVSWYNMFYPHDRALALRAGLRIMESQGLWSAPLTQEKLRTLWPLLLKSQYLPSAALRNPFTGQPIRLERSPGNLSLRTPNGRPILCLYDDNSRELQIDLTPNPTPTP